MACDRLDPAVRSFLHAYVTTAADLDVLLALMDNGSRWWDAQAMAAHAGLTPGEARRSLEHLASRNLLDIRISDALRYQLRPGTDDLDAALHAFAAAYHRTPGSIIRWTAARSRRSVSDFADAFRFKRR